jgi:hypothetical protein
LRQIHRQRQADRARADNQHLRFEFFTHCSLSPEISAGH